MSDAHDWVAATDIRVDRRRAEAANKSGRLLIVSRLAVTVHEVYCAKCRSSWRNGRDLPCRIGPQHIGGPRKQPDLDIGPMPAEEDESWPDQPELPLE